MSEKARQRQIMACILRGIARTHGILIDSDRPSVQRKLDYVMKGESWSDRLDRVNQAFKELIQKEIT